MHRLETQKLSFSVSIAMVLLPNSVNRKIQTLKFPAPFYLFVLYLLVVSFSHYFAWRSAHFSSTYAKKLFCTEE